jgi:hypothetical protein
MEKLSKYDSFQALKLNDDNSIVDTTIAIQRHEDLEDFMVLLRQHLVKKPCTQSKYTKSKSKNGQQLSQLPSQNL